MTARPLLPATLPTSGGLPRADQPSAGPAAPPGAPRGFFDFASTSLRGLSWPFWFLQGYLLIATSVVDEEWSAIGAFHPRMILGLLALAVATPRVLRGISTRRAAPPSVRNVPLAWLLAFLVATVVSTLWAFDAEASLPAELELATAMLGFVLLVGLLRTRREVLVTVLVTSLGAGIYVLRSFTEWLHGRGGFAMGVSRMFGAGHSTFDPNSFAATIVFAMPLVVWAAVRTRSTLLAVSGLAYALLTAFCVVMTHSRAGLVLYAIAAVGSFLMIPRGAVRVALLVAVAGVGVYLGASLNEKELARYESIFSGHTYEEEGSTRGRIVGYEVAWRIFEEHPVVGIGPGSWGAYRSRRVDGSTLEPHSLAGLLLASTGALGTATFVGYLLASFGLAFAVRRTVKSSSDRWDAAVRALAFTVGLTLVLHLVSGLAAHNLGRQGWYLYPALLYAAATARREPGDPAPEATA